MKVYRKDGDTLDILVFPHEVIRKGEYLLVRDEEKDYSLVVQVIDIKYIDSPGILDELVREGLLSGSTVYENDLINVGRASKFIKDTKLATAVIRGSIRGGFFSSIYNDLPSRADSRVERVSTSRVLSMVSRGSGRLRIVLGRDFDGNLVHIPAEGLDGSLTLITGMKGSGKSHLAKLLASSLVRYGAPILIFDLNGEYLGLANEELVEVFEGGRNLFFSLEYLGRDATLDIMVNVLGLPGVSANLFSEVWDIAVRRGYGITIDGLINVINNYVRNLMIRDALISRLMILKSCRFIRDGSSTRLEDLFDKYRGVIVNLRGLSSVERKVLVEIFLSKLVGLLERDVIPPLFLFAEEAHLYVRDTYWEDIVTRMRHFGLFVVFITNQPDSLGHEVFRQLDNIFIFRFQNDHDLDMLSRISNVDGATVKSIAKDLDRGRVLVVGNVVGNIPSVVEVSRLDYPAFGDTKRVFDYVVSASPE